TAVPLKQSYISPASVVHSAPLSRRFSLISFQSPRTQPASLKGRWLMKTSVAKTKSQRSLRLPVLRESPLIRAAQEPALPTDPALRAIANDLIAEAKYAVSIA